MKLEDLVKELEEAGFKSLPEKILAAILLIGMIVVLLGNFLFLLMLSVGD